MTEDAKRLFFQLIKHSLTVKGENCTENESHISPTGQVYDVKALTDSLEQAHGMAVRHQLSHLISFGATKEFPDVCAGASSKYKAEVFSAVMRRSAVDRETERIKKTLSDASIPFMLLKGAISKELYPESWMRSVRDIDILVPKELHETGCLSLCEGLGYCVTEKGTHDTQFKTPEGLCVELHFSLLEDNIFPVAAKRLGDAWSRALPTEKPFLFRMDDADFYLFHLVHMAKHFKNGGCGIRPLVDLWLFMQNGYRGEELTALLSDCGLLKFTVAMEQLCRIWFSDGKYSRELLMTEQYLLDGGISGDEKIFYVDTVRKYKSRGRYLLSIVFPTYSHLKSRYPHLDGRPLMYPCFYVKRLWDLTVGNRKDEGKQQLKNISHASFDEVSRLDTIWTSVGF